MPQQSWLAVALRVSRYLGILFVASPACANTVGTSEAQFVHSCTAVPVLAAAKAATAVGCASIRHGASRVQGPGGIGNSSG